MTLPNDCQNRRFGEAKKCIPAPGVRSNAAAGCYVTRAPRIERDKFLAAGDYGELGLGLVERNHVAICRMPKVRLDARLHASVQRDLIDRHRGQASVHDRAIVPRRVHARPWTACRSRPPKPTQEAVAARDAVDVLTENGTKIVSVIRLISESAEHTNLLTLNATSKLRAPATRAAASRSFAQEAKSFAS